MIAGAITTLGVGVGVAVTLFFGRPALVSLRRWLDWRYAARMQVRRKLELHRSLLAKAATADNCQTGNDDDDVASQARLSRDRSATTCRRTSARPIQHDGCTDDYRAHSSQR